MIIITTENDAQYAFHFKADVDAMLITDTGAVIFEPHPDVLATLEFPTAAVSVEEGDDPA